MATLKDVAVAAGVSPSTVSYVLSGKKKVREETAKRIYEAVAKLDYMPNMLASGLKTNSSMTIGVIVLDLQQSFFVEMIDSISDALDRAGYCMILCNSHNDPAQENAHLRKLMGRNIDGIILIGCGNNDYSELARRKIPIVCIDRFSGNLVTIKADNIFGGMLGTRYLIRKGYRKILFAQLEGLRFSEERLRGYMEAMTEADIREDAMTMCVHEQTTESAEREMGEYIDAGHRFDAVFCSTDYVAIGVMRALQKRGIRIPADVAVLGYDNIRQGNYTVPELTTVAQPKEEIGSSCVRYLIDMMHDSDADPHPMPLPPFIVERNSC